MTILAWPQREELKEQLDRKWACAVCGAARGQALHAQDGWRSAAESLERQVGALEGQLEELVEAALLRRAGRMEMEAEKAARGAANCAHAASQTAEEESVSTLKQRISELEAYARAGQREYEALVLCCEQGKMSQLALGPQTPGGGSLTAQQQRLMPVQGAVVVAEIQVAAKAGPCSETQEAGRSDGPSGATPPSSGMPQEPGSCGCRIGALVLKQQLQAALEELVRLQRSLAVKTERVRELEQLWAANGRQVSRHGAPGQELAILVAREAGKEEDSQELKTGSVATNDDAPEPNIGEGCRSPMMDDALDSSSMQSRSSAGSNSLEGGSCLPAISSSLR